MLHLPSFSIVIPTLNSANTLHQTLNSIALSYSAAQSRCPLQVLVCDSSSVDDTEEVIRSFFSKLDIRYIDVGPCTISHARNFGLLSSESDYIIFLDSDDNLSLDRLTQDFDNLSAFPSPIVYGSVLQNNTKCQSKSYISLPSPHYLLNNPISLPSLTISRSFLHSNQLYFVDGPDGRYGEDWRFVLQLPLKDSFLIPYQHTRATINVRSDSHTQLSIENRMCYVTFKFLCNHLFARGVTLLGLSHLYLYYLKTLFRLLYVPLITSEVSLSVNSNYIRKLLFFKPILSLLFLFLTPLLVPLSIYSQIFLHRGSTLSSFHKPLN